MNPPPLRLYCVRQTGMNGPYGQRGGGVFTSRQAAIGRCKIIKAYGGNPTIFVTSSLEWEEEDA